MIKGTPVSGGIVLARLLVFTDDELVAPRHQLAADAVDAELDRFRQAVARAGDEIRGIKAGMAGGGGNGLPEIFEAQLLILEDPLFIVETTNRIRKQQVNAEWAVHEVLEGFVREFSRVEDIYFRERLADISDVGRRVLHLLMEKQRPSLTGLDAEAILVARRLFPSDLAAADLTHIVGLITEDGSPTSHTAILARSRNLPAVVGAQELLSRAHTGDYAILDAYEGRLVVNPTPKQVTRYRAEQRRTRKVEEGLVSGAQAPAATLDGTAIEVLGNLEYVDDAAALLAQGGDGVGLFRSEYLFLNRPELPGEEEQYRAYAALIDRLGGKPVTIRTIDIGGDKFASLPSRPPELNPFLGLRAIRLSLASKELFRNQMNALLRAAVHGPLAVMLPMVSSVEELQRVKKLIGECRNELTRRGVPFQREAPLGIMVEVPSAAVALDTMINEVQFISVGTNDLVQYVLAAERGNQQVAEYYQPYHPAVLRLIANVVNVAGYSRCPVSVCGELAWHPVFVVYFLGLGIRKLSMGSNAIPEVKQLVRTLDLAGCQRHAENLLALGSTRAVERYARRELLPAIEREMPELARRYFQHESAV